MQSTPRYPSDRRICEHGIKYLWHGARNRGLFCRKHAPISQATNPTMTDIIYYKVNFLRMEILAISWGHRAWNLTLDFLISFLKCRGQAPNQAR